MIILNKIYTTVFMVLFLGSFLSDINALPHGQLGESKEQHGAGHQGPQRTHKSQHGPEHKIQKRPHLQHGSKGFEKSESSQIEQSSQKQQRTQLQEFQQQDNSQVHHEAKHQEFKRHQGSQVQEGTQYQALQEQQASQAQQGAQYQELQQHDGTQVRQGATYQEIQEQQESQTQQGAQYQEFQQQQGSQGQYQELQGSQIHPGARHREFQGRQESQQGEQYPEYQGKQASQVHQGPRYHELQGHQGLQVHPGARYQEFQQHQGTNVQQAVQYQDFPGQNAGQGHLVPQYQDFQGHPAVQGPHRYYFHDGRRYYPQHHEWQRGYHQYHEPGYPEIYPSLPDFPYAPGHPDYEAAHNAYSQNQQYFYKSDGSKVKFTYIPLHNSRDSKIIIPGPGDKSNIKYVRISQDGEYGQYDEKSVNQIRQSGSSESQIVAEDNSVNQQKVYQEQGQAVSTASATASTTSSDSSASVSAISSSGPDQGSKRAKPKRKHGRRRSHNREIDQSEDGLEVSDNVSEKRKKIKHSDKHVIQESDISKQDTSSSKQETVTVINKDSDTMKDSSSEHSKKETIEINKKRGKKHFYRKRIDGSYDQQDNGQFDRKTDLRSKNSEAEVYLEREYDEAATRNKDSNDYSSTKDKKQITIESSNQQYNQKQRKRGPYGQRTESEKLDSDPKQKNAEVLLVQDESEVVIKDSEEYRKAKGKKQTSSESSNQNNGHKQRKRGSYHQLTDSEQFDSDHESLKTEGIIEHDESDVVIKDSDEYSKTKGKKQIAIESSNQQYVQKQQKHGSYDQQTESEQFDSDLKSQNAEEIIVQDESDKDADEYSKTIGKKQSTIESSNQKYNQKQQTKDYKQFDTNSDLRSQDSEVNNFSDKEVQDESETIVNEESYSEDKVKNSDDNENEEDIEEADEVVKGEEYDKENYQDDYLENTPNKDEAIISETTVANENSKKYKDASDSQTSIENYAPCEEDDKSQTVTTVTDTQSKNAQSSKKSYWSGLYSTVLGQSKKTKSSQESDQNTVSEDEIVDENSEYSSYDEVTNIANYAAAYSIAKAIATSAMQGQDGMIKVFEDPAVKVYVQPLVQRFLPYYLQLKEIVEKFNKASN